MKIFAIRTIYGELIGRVSDSTQTNEQIEAKGFIELERPLMLNVMPMPTPRGVQMMNTMLPVSQLMEVDVLPVPRQHIVAFGEAAPEAAKAYLQATSGIAMPQNSGANGLHLVKG
jgi:hypothetical protein